MADGEKLETTAAAKVSMGLGLRMRAVAEASGMKDSQVYRLILERADEIFRKHWHPQMNPRFFLEQIEISEEKLNRFFLCDDGLKRLKR